MKSDKLQTFKDTRWGFTATLRIDFYASKPFILRVKEADGKPICKQSFDTAHGAKLALDSMILPGHQSAGNWWTVKGCVCDIC